MRILTEKEIHSNVISGGSDIGMAAGIGPIILAFLGVVTVGGGLVLGLGGYTAYAAYQYFNAKSE
ncbi:MAG: hypothetical protein JSR17_06900 [Proteobacteria bacterium]|nr:hypothetical protein [Pseudomonadota bacterium]